MSSSLNPDPDVRRGTSRAARILLAAYHFPPSAAVGGLRVARLARHLPEFGWEPFVLTADDADRDQEEGLDPSRLAGLERVSITRTRPMRGVFSLHGRVRSGLRRSASTAGAAEPSGADREVRRAGRESLPRRLKRYAASFLILMPDSEKRWSLPASLAAVRLIRRHKIDYVFTSGPPFSVHFIGLVAKLLTGVKWAADFRDPWFEMLTDRTPQFRSWLSNRIELWMEAIVMHGSDKVLATTERMRASMRRRYPTVPDERFACLPNGIDLRRAVSGSDVEKYGPLTITYTGTLYYNRTPQPIFEALGELVREGKARPSDFRIKLVGSCRSIGHEDTMAIARRLGVEDAVEIIDFVPHGEAIDIMRRSHLLLVLAPPNHELVLPAKIFDYLGSGSTLLALAEPGATSDLMHETDAGRCFSQRDVSGLKDYFLELLTGGRYLDLGNEPGRFARYDARALTGQLVSELSDSAAHTDAATVRP